MKSRGKETGHVLRRFVMINTSYKKYFMKRE